MSGRGLEFTGGTLDKLESIAGFETELTRERLKDCIMKNGCFIVSPTEDVCPGDKKIYKIRDITCTVDNEGLIVASILSKKIAEGAKFLVLDIKVGCAAFKKTVEAAKELASLMLKIAKKLNLEMRCVLTRMDNPIGKKIGNSLEVIEAVECLHGQGPEDLVEIVAHLGGELLHMCGKSTSVENGKQLIKQIIANGEALRHFNSMLVNQGVSKANADKLCSGNYNGVISIASKQTSLRAKESGWVAGINGLPIAEVCKELGAGRFSTTDKLDLAAGAEILVDVGAEIKNGQEWITIHHNKNLTEEMKEKISSALIVNKEKPNVMSRIIETISL